MVLMKGNKSLNKAEPGGHSNLHVFICCTYLLRVYYTPEIEIIIRDMKTNYDTDPAPKNFQSK